MQVISRQSLALTNPVPNQYVALGGVPVPSGAFTVAFWFKPATVSGSQIMYGQGAAPGADHFHCRLDNAQLDFTSGTFSFVGGGVVTAGLWHHAAYCYDGAALTTYLDGFPVFGPAAGTPDYGGGAARLGSPFGSDLGLNGGLDDFRVYPFALSAAQVAQLARGEDVAGAADYWPFEEGSGTTTADAAGGLTGTLLNGAAFSADVPPQLAARAPTGIPLAWSADAARTMLWGADVARTNDYGFNRGESLQWLCSPAVPTNITGWTLARYVRKRRFDPARSDNPPVLLTVTATPTANGSALTVVDSAAGVYLATLKAGDNLSLGAGQFFYDDWRIDAGFETMLAEGTWQVNKAAKG